MRTTIIILAAFAAFTAQAIPIDLGPDQTTNLIERHVAQFPGQQIAGPSLFSLALEFNKPVRARDNSGMEMVLACRAYWQTTLHDVLATVSLDAYLEDAAGDWSLIPSEIGISPFDAMWLKVPIDDPMTVYGIRYDMHLPQMYFGQPDLWVRSRDKPFSVGAVVPESGATLGFLVLGLVACVGAQKMIKSRKEE